ncbi:MAG: hypothetical protein RRC34_03465 [Lentisphaeria bacterium]|nr:hypothetical protein [Lentisphaeria bacterium]
MVNIHTFIHSSIFLIILLPLSGCFEMEQIIELEENGGMRFALHYAIPETHTAAFTQFHQATRQWQGENPNDTWLLNKQAVHRQFPKPMFESTDYQVYSKAGKKHIRIAGTAKSASSALLSGAVGDFKLETLENGDQRLELALPTLSQSASLSAEERQALLKAAEGLSVKLIIQTPAAVKTTNGQKNGEKKVTWTFGPGQAADPGQLPPSLFVTY